MHLTPEPPDEIVNQIEEQLLRITMLEALLDQHLPAWKELYQEMMNTGPTASEAWTHAQKATKPIRDELRQLRAAQADPASA
jgi:hypothetical protein